MAKVMEGGHYLVVKEYWPNHKESIRSNIRRRNGEPLVIIKYQIEEMERVKTIKSSYGGWR